MCTLLLRIAGLKEGVLLTESGGWVRQSASQTCCLEEDIVVLLY